MPTLLPILNIPATPNDAFNPNQARLPITSPSPSEEADTYLSICEEEIILDPVKLNVSCILTKTYDENQANNIFNNLLYQTLYSLLQEKGIMYEANSFIRFELMLDLLQDNGRYEQILALDLVYWHKQSIT